MADEMMVKELEEVVVRFSGDSGDGMQLAGNIFSNVSATVGNDICTFPDYPADIRAPQGSLTGVSGFQVHIGAGQVYTPGDRCHVLVAMNPSALKTQIKFCKPQGLIITDSDSFEARDLEKAQFKTNNPFEELGIKQEVLEVPISSMCKESLKDSGLDNKSILRCKNMFALGLVCWLFNRNLAAAEKMLREKFAKKPEIAEANIKVLNDGYNYGANKKDRVKKAFFLQFKICVIFTCISWAIMMLTPQLFAGIFTSDKVLVNYTAWALRIYMAGIFYQVKIKKIDLYYIHKFNISQVKPLFLLK